MDIPYIDGPETYQEDDRHEIQQQDPDEQPSHSRTQTFGKSDRETVEGIPDEAYMVLPNAINVLQGEKKYDQLKKLYSKGHSRTNSIHSGHELSASSSIHNFRGGNHSSTAQRLSVENNRRKQAIINKFEKESKKRLNKMQGLTFRPNTSSTHSLNQTSSLREKSESAIRCTDSLYQRAVESREQKKIACLEKEMTSKEKELSTCTFKPNISQTQDLNKTGQKIFRQSTRSMSNSRTADGAAHLTGIYDRT